MKQFEFNFYENEDIYNPNSFIIYNENIEAYYYLNQDNIPFLDKSQIIFLTGEKKSGKTYLGHIWKQRHNAKFINYDNFKLAFENFSINISKNIEYYEYYILDNFENNFDEEKLFFLLNLILQKHSQILIITNFNIKRRKILLNDLKSRINSAIFLNIKNLSKEIKPMFIIKLFNDNNVKISGQNLKFLVSKLPNNYEKIYLIINNLSVFLKNNNVKITSAIIKSFF